MYVLTQNGAVVQYPYTIEQLRKDNPQTSFPRNPTPATLESFGVFGVLVVGQPEHDRNTHKAVEGAPVRERRRNPDGTFVADDPATPESEAWRWVQTWVVVPLTAEEMQQQSAQLQASIVAATQQRLDDFARTRNYDGILSAATYATSTVPTFAAEGQYAVQARDATWASLYQIMAEVQAGTRPMPSGYAEIEGDLPELAWPI
jgi:hypothetical protein